jgi:hypothetical protein
LREKFEIISEQIQKRRKQSYCSKDIFHTLPLSTLSPDILLIHRGAVWAVPTVYVQHVLNVLDINALRD